MDIGNQIRDGRARLGLSQDELAQKLYVSRVTINHWETGKSIPDAQSMLLLANLFGTTIDELVKGDVGEMREMVEKRERRTRVLAAALGGAEVVVVAVLAITAMVGREYLELVLRLLLAVLVLVVSLTMLVARWNGDGKRAESAATLLSAATGDPAKAPGETTAAHAMRLVLQVLAGLLVAIAVLVVGGLFLKL